MLQTPSALHPVGTHADHMYINTIKLTVSCVLWLSSEYSGQHGWLGRVGGQDGDPIEIRPTRNMGDLPWVSVGNDIMGVIYSVRSTTRGRQTGSCITARVARL